MATDDTDRGRDIRAEARRVSKPSRAVVLAYEDWLASSSGTTKPPAMAAELMGVIYELAKNKLPCPRREVLAEVIGGAKSKYTVDAVLYAQRAQGNLDLRIETVTGNTQKREGIRQVRYIVPTKEVLSIGKKAERNG